MKNSTKKKTNIRSANRSGQASAWVVLIAAGLLLYGVIAVIIDKNNRSECWDWNCTRPANDGSLLQLARRPSEDMDKW